MSDLPWVKVGWSVRVKAKAGSGFGVDGRTEVVGLVSQVDNDHAKWFRIGCLDTSYFVAYGQVESIRILDSDYELEIERVT